MGKSKKMINFDLHTDVLKQVFGVNNYTKGYSEIRKFFESNGFEHIQHSVYLSKEPMSIPEVYALCSNMGKKLKWLSSAVNKAAVSSPPQKYDICSAFTSDDIDDLDDPLLIYDSVEDEYSKGR